MKKNMLFTMMIVSSSLLLFSQTVTVKKPGPGSLQARGNKLVIKWVNNQESGNPRSVNLALFARGKFGEIASIADSTENNGGYEWLIPLTVPTGEYFVRVRDLTKTKILGDSMKFRIIPETAVPLRPRDPCLLSQDQTADLVLDSLQVISVQNNEAVFHVGIRNAGKRCLKDINLQIFLNYHEQRLIRVETDYFGDGRVWLLKGGEKIVWIGSIGRNGIGKKSNLQVKVWSNPPHDFSQNNNLSNDTKDTFIVWEN